MRGLEIRRPGVAVPLLAATVALAAGCTVSVVPPPPAPAAAPPAATRTVAATTPAAASSSSRVTRPGPAVGLATFAGKWSGHTRSLTVSAAGRGHEVVYEGCCTQRPDLTFQLSNPRGTGVAHASATATVTAVAFDAGSGPGPKVGQTGTVSLVDGVLTVLDGFTYCDAAAAALSACGA